MNRTNEQLDILSAATETKKNLMLDANAGTGKTTTLRMVERAVPKQPILYLVFNKKNSVDAEYIEESYYDRHLNEHPEWADDYETEASRRMLSTTNVRTFNSLGHRVWASTQGKKLTLNSKKSGDIFRDLISSSPKNAQSEMWESYSEVIDGVAMAKALGYVPDGKFPAAKRLISQKDFHRQLNERPDELTSDLIDAVLVRSISASYEGYIDYNDQIYMPALFGGSFSRYSLILIDEFQDLSPVNHAMLERLIKGRAIGVGDPYQNIYGFRGAKAGGMDQATEKYSMQRLPLSISFRCPSAIVDHVKWRVPHFKAMNEGGEVVKSSGMAGDNISDSATIICRNNAPLFSLAFRLLGNGNSVSVTGSDIGPKLVGMMKRLGSDEMNQAQTLAAIDGWLEDKLEKESKNAIDMAECMKVFVKQASSLGTAIAYAEHLFHQSGSIRLLTGHKAKGLEFDDVIHLDPQLLQPTEQDNNLSYVISTRSKNRLTEIASTDIKW